MSPENTFEKFPIKEKLATNLDDQLAWLIREAVYSRDKTKGYEAKLERLATDPSERLSTLGFMENEWFQSKGKDQILAAMVGTGDERAASVALQFKGKTIAFLVDKVALTFWMRDGLTGSSHTPEELLIEAHQSVKEKVQDMRSQYTDEELLAFNEASVADNPLVRAAGKLHEAYAHDSSDTETLANVAIEGSAVGVLIWQAYARLMEQLGFPVELPQPGISRGNIEVWA